LVVLVVDVPGVAEVAPPNVVDLRAVVDVGQVDDDLDNVGNLRAGVVQNQLEVVEDLLGWATGSPAPTTSPSGPNPTKPETPVGAPPSVSR
jgi:hypothetical protein